MDEIRNYLIEGISQNELMSKRYKKVCRALNYIDHLLIVISTITGRAFISAFAFLVGIPVGIASCAIGLKICVITPEIKRYKSIIKKKRKNHVFLAKSNLNDIEVLVSNAFIYSNISHNEFVLINNVLKQFYDMKEEIKNSNGKQTIYKTMVSYCLKCRKKYRK